MMHLYANVKVKGQSFKGVKKQVVPRQSMSLREIITRFVKREPLPAMREGVYEDRFPYDLEKLSTLDVVEQHELIDELRVEGSRLKAKLSAEEKVKADIAAAEKEMDRQKWLEELRQSDPSKPKQP